jgi:hypothetical protein
MNNDSPEIWEKRRISLSFSQCGQTERIFAKRAMFLRPQAHFLLPKSPSSQILITQNIIFSKEVVWPKNIITM